MIKQLLIAATASLSTLAATIPATPAAAAAQGLVAVSIGDVSILNNFLNSAQIAALNNLSVPVTVQAPIGVAANVCGTTVAVLGAAGSGAACDATSGSEALAQLVNRQLLHQTR
jgi:hypothetical protein